MSWNPADRVGRVFRPASLRSLAFLTVAAIAASLVAILMAHNTGAQANPTFAISAYQPWSGYGVQMGSWQSGDFNGDGKGDLIHLWGPDTTNSSSTTA